MSRRSAILAKPAWTALGTHPAVARMPIDVLAALDSLFDHMIAFGLEQPDSGDLRAWSDLGPGIAGLERVLQGLAALDPADPSLVLVRDALDCQRAKAAFAGASSKGRLRYDRSVSVPLSELPDRWRLLLADLAERRARGEGDAPAPDIQIRMVQKLGQYIHVMRAEGLPENLHLEGLRAFYRVIATRPSPQTGGPLRPATRRATWEELERFARLSGDYPEDLLAALRKTLGTLQKEEDLVLSLKYQKAHGVGDPPQIIAGAIQMLREAGAEKEPWQRHMRRNRAAAIALPAILPLRREWHRIVFGETLYWAGDRYRFRDFKPKKTALLDNRRTFPGSVHPRLTRFIDALVLQDNDPRYLTALREHLERERRPLFVHADGAVCSKNFVTRVWSEIHLTGAHIARTLVHDFFGVRGDDGVEKAMVLCDQMSFGTVKNYQGASVARRQIDFAHQELEAEFEDLMAG